MTDILIIADGAGVTADLLRQAEQADVIVVHEPYSGVEVAKNRNDDDVEVIDG